MKKKKPQSTARETLLARTRKLLRESDQSHLQIYKATGLTPFWLSSIATGKVADPSVNRIQALYEFLSGKELSF